MDSKLDQLGQRLATCRKALADSLPSDGLKALFATYCRIELDLVLELMREVEAQRLQAARTRDELARAIAKAQAALRGGA